MPADNFARQLSANRYFPDPPGIVLWCDTGLFPAFNRQRGNKAVSKPTNPNGGRGKRLPPRAKAMGQSRMVPPGGFLRGEQFERERVAGFFASFLAGARKEGPAGKRLQKTD